MNACRGRGRSLTILLAAWAAAQEPAPIASGPQRGTEVSPVRVYAPYGKYGGREFDAAAEIGKAPGAFLFLHEISRNTAPLIRGLDRLGEDYEILGFKTFAVMTTNDRTKAEADADRVSRAIQMQNPIVISLDGVDGPGNYALDKKCTLTLVLVKDGKVQRSVGFTDTGRQDLPQVKQWVEELTGQIPTDDAMLRAAIASHLPEQPDALRAHSIELTMEVRRLRQRLQEMQERQGNQRRQPERGMREQPMREPPAGERGQPPPPQRPREGKPPEDDELRELLRSAINRFATAEDLDEVFAAIDQRIGDDPALLAQGIDMFKLMLSLDYGTDAAKQRARAWLDRRKQVQGGTR